MGETGYRRVRLSHLAILRQNLTRPAKVESAIPRGLSPVELQCSCTSRKTISQAIIGEPGNQSGERIGGASGLLCHCSRSP